MPGGMKGSRHRAAKPATSVARGVEPLIVQGEALDEVFAEACGVGFDASTARVTGDNCSAAGGMGWGRGAVEGRATGILAPKLFSRRDR